MIIKALLNLVYKVFEILTFPINVPSFPDGMLDFVNTYLGYLSNGLEVLANYVDVTYLLSIFVIVLGVDIAIFTYKVVMWIIRKIPMLSIS